MPRLELRLLGGFEAIVGGHVVTFPTRHAALLLARLALEPDRALTRERLAAFLWPARTEEQARVSLRQALYRLRGALADAEPEPLRVEGQSLMLVGAAVACDLTDLEAADPQDPEALAHAVAQARGALLEGVELGEPEVDGWLMTERTRVQALVMKRLRQLAAVREGERRFGDVEALALRQLALEPYDESAMRALMAALAHQGRRGAAMAAFRTGADRLRGDLGVAPEAETTALWQAIRDGKVVAVAPGPDDAAIPAEALLPDPPPPLERPETESDARRRHVTILHLSSLTVAVRADWDPEALAEAAAALGDRLESAVTSHGGQMLRSGSGEVVARFAGEFSALAAVRAALALQDDDGISAGIHVGDELLDGRDDPGPLGLLARRLADAGGVILSEEARLACEGYVVLTAGPSLSLPGAGAAVRTWRAVAVTGARSSWQARAGRRLTPFVGRGAELAILHQALERSEAGTVAVWLSGEAGMGKSRLLHEFLASPRVRARKVIEVGAAAWQAEDPHAALGALLRAVVGLGPELGAGPAWEAIARRLDALGAPSSIGEPLRILFDLPVDEDWTSLAIGHRRRRIVEALGTLITLEAEEQPVILAVEDAHWFDAESWQTLDGVVRQLGSAPVLLVVTARPDMQPAWLGRSFAQHVRLVGFDVPGTARFLHGFAPNDVASPDRAVRLHTRTGGVPLFIEEVVQHMAGAAGDEDGAGAPVPASLQALLAARIERLTSHQRQVLQAASVIGPTAPASLLQALAGLPAETLEQALDGLAASELLYRVGGRPEPRYAFKHALTQEAAHRSLLRASRDDLHRRLLALWEARAENGAEVAPEDLARHAQLGGVWDKAATYEAWAGERAMARSAPAAARAHFERALEALAHLPADERTRGLSADLRVRLRPALMLTGQYGRVLGLLGAAEADAATLDDERRLAEIRTHMAFFHATDGSFDSGLQIAGLAEAGARRLADPVLLAETALAKGELLRRRGDYKAAIGLLEASLATWTGERRLHRGINIGTRSVFVRGHLAVCHAYLGHRAAARAIADEGRALAEETGRAVDRLFALLHDGIVTELEGRVAESIPLFEAALGLAHLAELPFFADWIIVELGEALMALGDGRRALALLEAACSRPAETIVPQFDALARVALGKALVMAGRPDAAEAALAGVHGYARRVGHRQLEQMALRRIAMSVAVRDPARALVLVDEAIAVAEGGGLTLGLAKSLEVRAAILRDLGRDGEAVRGDARAAAVWEELDLPGWDGHLEGVG